MRLAVAQACVLLAPALALGLASPSAHAQHGHDDLTTQTPIKHVVVIFQENVSFDHYFGTYPDAMKNKDGSVYFQAAKGTPTVNNLVSSGLLTNNPNGVNPFRIDRSVPNTCDEDHNYNDEQYAFHGGLMDRFAKTTCNDPNLGPHSNMGYYDGNTVTALWNYAQNFAMSDNSYGTTFGPSTPGLLNLVAGNTYEGMVMNGLSPNGYIAGGLTAGTVIGDADPADDKCSSPSRTQIRMTGQNIGDLLNEKNITWGSFMGGFDDCAHNSTGITGLTTADYIPHHAFFQYWASTANPNHVKPTSVAMIGHQGDAANHEYDVTDFFAALAAGNLPAVSFIKAPAIEDAHAGYSDPIDEQYFLVKTINALEESGDWKDTAVVISWDDSDGWYDHAMGPIVNQSHIAEDQLLGPGDCGTPSATQVAGLTQQGRCGYGPRLPLLVISPYAKENFVDHTVTDQSSIIRFIEDNWSLGRIGNGSTDTIAGTLDGMFDFSGHDAGGHVLFLNPNTGEPENRGRAKDR
ncbi:MAG TPA: alkaline phosphatase family protein [Acidobacteriaceae bacterium]|nr:alkaline phosphatase family protein [Acidobacteriaceae bacterium]